MPFAFPYPIAFPDPLDPQAVQDTANLISGQDTTIPERGTAPPPPIVARETEIAETGDYDPLEQDAGVSTNMLDQTGLAEASTEGIYGLIPPQQQGQPAVVQPKQRDMDRAGGIGPISDQQREAENMAQSAERQGQDAEIENNRLADVYREEARRQELAAGEWRSRQIQDQDFYQRRAQEIDKLSDAIARKKIDEGRWIRNPGNFFAAIGAALVGMGSGDSTVGYRLIDQAIQRDLAEQKYESDQMRADKLGLENNVQLYRQLMGDRQAGDMVHEAKLRQSTAMKVEEIAAQLRSKEARERGIMLASELRKQAAQLMQIANAAAFMPPRMQSKALADAQTNFGDVLKFGPNQNQAAPGTAANRATGQAVGNASASQPVGSGYVGPSQGGGGNAPGMAQGRPGQSKAPSEEPITVGTTYDEISPEKGRTPTDYKSAANMLPSWDRKRVEEAAKAAEDAIGVPGAGYLVIKARIHELATVQATHPGNVVEQNRLLTKRREEAQARLAAKAKDVADVEAKAATWADLLRANAELRRHFKDANGDTDYAAIDKWLGQGWKKGFGSPTYNFYNNVRELMNSPGASNSLDARQRRAALVYAGKLQAVVNAYGHEVSGGAITSIGPEGGEFGRLKAVMSSDDPSAKLFAISDQNSRILGTRLMRHISPGSKAGDVVMYLAQRGIRTSGLPVEGR